jgi:ribonuclease BN (tRNA processing enzyme)
MKITFLGSGSAFCFNNFQSNILIEINDKKLLFDCGSDIRWAMKEQNLTVKDIDAIYISHLHADHIGGLEYFAFASYFSSMDKIKLFGNSDILRDMWNKCLSGGLESLQTVDANLRTYFDIPKIISNEFKFEDQTFKMVQTVHVVADRSIVKSFGLLFTVPDSKKTIFITSDTQFAPSQLMDFINISDIVFHDCETTKFESRVHAHYNYLKTLPEHLKNKIWLYHYSDGELPDAKSDGFQGFVKKGQSFTI